MAARSTGGRVDGLRLSPFRGTQGRRGHQQCLYRDPFSEASNKNRQAHAFNLLHNPADMRCSLGEVLLAKTRREEAGEVLTRTVSLDSKNARAHYFLALAQPTQGMLQQPLQHYSNACSLQPAVDTVSELHCLMSVNLSRAGQTQKTLKALELAKANGDSNLAELIKARTKGYRQKCRSNRAAGGAREAPAGYSLLRSPRDSVRIPSPPNIQIVTVEGSGTVAYICAPKSTGTVFISNNQFGDETVPMFCQ